MKKNKTAHKIKRINRLLFFINRASIYGSEGEEENEVLFAFDNSILK